MGEIIARNVWSWLKLSIKLLLLHLVGCLYQCNIQFFWHVTPFRTIAELQPPRSGNPRRVAAECPTIRTSPPLIGLLNRNDELRSSETSATTRPDVVTSKYQYRYENNTWVHDVTNTKGKRIWNGRYIIQSCGCFELCLWVSSHLINHILLEWAWYEVLISQQLLSKHLSTMNDEVLISKRLFSKHMPTMNHELLISNQLLSKHLSTMNHEVLHL